MLKFEVAELTQSPATFKAAYPKFVAAGGKRAGPGDRLGRMNEERWKPSVTVAAIVARERQGQTQYLLVQERTESGLRLNNPAGHLEPGESPEQGAVRETLEETARRFEPDGFLGIYLARSPAPDGRETSYVRLAFTGTVGEADASLRLDEGIVGTLWLTLPELRARRAEHRSPLVQRCVEDHAAGRRLPLSAVFTDASVFGQEAP